MRGMIKFMRRQFYWVAVGTALVAAPFAIFYPPAVIVIVAYMLLQHGTEAQKQRYLPRMSTGEVRGAFSVKIR